MTPVYVITMIALCACVSVLNGAPMSRGLFEDDETPDKRGGIANSLRGNGFHQSVHGFKRGGIPQNLRGNSFHDSLYPTKRGNSFHGPTALRRREQTANDVAENGARERRDYFDWGSIWTSSNDDDQWGDPWDEYNYVYDFYDGDYYNWYDNYDNYYWGYDDWPRRRDLQNDESYKRNQRESSRHKRSARKHNPSPNKNNLKRTEYQNTRQHHELGERDYLPFLGVPANYSPLGSSYNQASQNPWDVYGTPYDNNYNNGYWYNGYYYYNYYDGYYNYYDTRSRQQRTNPSNEHTNEQSIQNGEVTLKKSNTKSSPQNGNTESITKNTNHYTAKKDKLASETDEQNQKRGKIDTQYDTLIKRQVAEHANEKAQSIKNGPTTLTKSHTESSPQNGITESITKNANHINLYKKKDQLASETDAQSQKRSKIDTQFKPKIKISNRDYFGSIIGNTGALDNDNFGQSYSSMGDYSNYGGGNSVNNVGDYYYIYDDDDFYYYDDVPYYVEQAKRARGTTERRRAPTRELSRSDNLGSDIANGPGSIGYDDGLSPYKRMFPTMMKARSLVQRTFRENQKRRAPTVGTSSLLDAIKRYLEEK